MTHLAAAQADPSKALLNAPATRSRCLAALLITAVWAGIAGGIVEGIGLLLFQRINWQRWGLTPHVSSEIIWISPMVDVALFVAAAIVIAILSGLRPREKALSTLVFFVVLISIYRLGSAMNISSS